MIKRYWAGVVFFLLGLLIAVGPHTMFPVCGAMGDNLMKYHWTDGYFANGLHRG